MLLDAEKVWLSEAPADVRAGAARKAKRWRVQAFLRAAAHDHAAVLALLMDEGGVHAGTRLEDLDGGAGGGGGGVDDAVFGGHELAKQALTKEVELEAEAARAAVAELRKLARERDDPVRAVARAMRGAMERLHMTATALFRNFDKNADNMVSLDEFNDGLREYLGLELPPREVGALFVKFDPDGSGEIDLGEIIALLKETARADAATDAKMVAARAAAADPAAHVGEHGAAAKRRRTKGGARKRRRGARGGKRSGGVGMTPLHKCGLFGAAQAAALLLARGAAVDARTFDKGRTPLHLACLVGHAATAKLLLHHGAKARARASDGKTALDFAKADRAERRCSDHSHAAVPGFIAPGERRRGQAEGAPPSPSALMLADKTAVRLLMGVARSTCCVCDHVASEQRAARHATKAAARSTHQRSANEEGGGGGGGGGGGRHRHRLHERAPELSGGGGGPAAQAAALAELRRSRLPERYRHAGDAAAVQMSAAAEFGAPNPFAVAVEREYAKRRSKTAAPTVRFASACADASAARGGGGGGGKGTGRPTNAKRRRRRGRKRRGKKSAGGAGGKGLPGIAEEGNYAIGADTTEAIVQAVCSKVRRMAYDRHMTMTSVFMNFARRIYAEHFFSSNALTCLPASPRCSCFRNALRSPLGRTRT